MKKKIIKLLGVGLTLVMVLSLAGIFAPVAIAADYKENDWGEWGLPDTDPGTDVGPIAVAPDGTLFAAVGTGTLGDLGGDTSAVWSTTQEHSGDNSAELTHDATSPGTAGSVYVEFVPAGGITLQDFEDDFSGTDTTPEEWSFWHYTPAISSNWAQIELKFEDSSSAGWVEITAVPLQGHTGIADWDDEVLAGTTVAGYGGWGEAGSGASFFAWTPPLTALSGIEGAVTGEGNVTDASDWQLTRVRIELWEAIDRTVYIDDVTINGITYNLEPPKLVMSEDNGYSWDDTDLDPAIAQIVGIAISPNYEEDETLYVGCTDGTVYRLEEAGDDVTAIKPLVDSAGSYADSLYSIDVYTDDADYNWVIVGCELDVLVLKDKVFEDWRDQELGSIYDLSGNDENHGLEVAFAPDFDESELIWAVTVDPTSYGFLVTSTESPGNWGQDVDEALIIDAADGTVIWTTFLDMDFPDDYDSDDAVVYVGVTGCDPGAAGTGNGDSGVYLIEGVAGDGDATDFESVCVEISVDETMGDIHSIAVSGDYGDVTILAGELGIPEVWISDDGDGEDWDDADKNPTGQGLTYVCMEADVVWGGSVFDPEEGMAFATTSGDESAVSRSNDGGWVYNQVGYIDHNIDELWDMAFHPDFPDEAVFLLITEDTTDTPDTSSLWLTENGDEDDPDYIRVLCGVDGGGAPGNLAGWFGDFTTYHGLVEFAQDAEAIYLHGEDDTNDESIWKSTDDGQTFGKRRDVKSSGVYAEIMDWVITDDDNIYAAVDPASGDYGFYKTDNSGLSWTAVDTDNVNGMNSIALSPDFDAEEEEGYILLGGTAGDIQMSDDVGDAFEDAEKEEEAYLENNVYVAFDADFADEDADGYMYIYAADNNGSDIMEGEVTDTDDVDWDELEDDDGDGLAQAIYCVGLQVAEDNALYAMGSGITATAAATEVDGTLELTDGTNTDTFAIPDTTITVASGTFVDDESLSITGYTLTVTGTDLISGTIDVEGDDSEATGTFSVSITVSGWTNVDATVVSDDLWAEVTTAVAEDIALFRLLLWESNNLWESQSDASLDDPMGLWLTAGTNVLWTIDTFNVGTVAPDLWALEDTCSGQVTLDSPPTGYKSDYEDQMRVSWDEVRDADEYEVKYYHVPTGDSTVEDEIEDTDILLTGLSDSSEYEWKVRVSPDEPWHSRWSGKWSFHTALGEPPWTPTLYTPGGVWQYSGIDVDLMPAFSWESATSADSYQFMLADNAAFTSPLVNEKVPESAYQLDFELEYNSNYFWRVMAYDGNVAISRWSDIGAFTTIEKVVPTPPAPTPTLTVEPAVPIVLPTPLPPALLWTIIGIGALLIIAVIVLIIRTRRPV